MFWLLTLCTTPHNVVDDAFGVESATWKETSATKGSADSGKGSAQTSGTATSTTTDAVDPVKKQGDTSSSSSRTPLPAATLHTISQLWHNECGQECEGEPALGGEEDSFLKFYETPHFLAADWSPPRIRTGVWTATTKEPVETEGTPEPSPLPCLKDLTICVHQPRQLLPSDGYDIKWQVDEPLVTGLFRMRATVVREFTLAQYDIHGQPIEVHQDGQRLEIARLTCYRFRPRLLRTCTEDWQTKYPAVATFLECIPENEQEVHQPFGVHSVSQLLLEDLHVHPDFRGGGLGLSLLDHASRRVGDALTSVVLGLPAREKLRRRDSDDRSILEHYFGLLGFESMHANYMARVNRVMLEEASPLAPVLDEEWLDYP